MKFLDSSSVLTARFVGFSPANNVAKSQEKLQSRGTIDTLHFRSIQGVQTDNLSRHVQALTEQAKVQGDSENYIRTHWQKLGLTVQDDPFIDNNHTYHNLSVSMGPKDAEYIIVSSHYDSPQPGGRTRVLPQADYCASGISGLLELTRILKQQESKLTKRIVLVAYANEQPPYERTQYKASEAHVNILKQAKAPVKAMISLDMIGYFSDKKKSQNYPLPLRLLKYVIPGLTKRFPDTGNFIAIVGDLNSQPLIQNLKKSIEAHAKIDVTVIATPRFLRGTDFSDHRYFSRNGYQAVMVTDTGFMRNTNHYGWNGEKDTADTLNVEKMAEVIKGIQGFIQDTSRS